MGFEVDLGTNKGLAPDSGGGCLGGSAHVGADEGDGIVMGLPICFGAVQQVVDPVEVLADHKNKISL